MKQMTIANNLTMTVHHQATKLSRSLLIMSTRTFLMVNLSLTNCFVILPHVKKAGQSSKADSADCVMQSSLEIPPHLRGVSTLPCETLRVQTLI